MTSRRLLPVILLVVAALATVGGYFGFRYFEQSHPGVVDLQSAWLAVRADPRDAQRWAVLADAQAAIDQAQAAEQSYLTAVRLGSKDATVYGRLGFLLYGHGRDQEALSALRQAKDLGAELPLLDGTIADLEERLAPPEPPPGFEPEVPEPDEEEEQDPDAAEADDDELPSGQGYCTVAAPRLGQMGPFVVTTELLGTEVPLVVDTGASLTTLDYDLVVELDAPIDEERTINAITATGPAVFPTALIEEVDLGGRRIRNLTVAVCEGCGGRGARGLLGLDVQAALGVELEIANAQLRFVDCEE